jgi:hypothetical protein
MLSARASYASLRAAPSAAVQYSSLHPERGSKASGASVGGWAAGGQAVCVPQQAGAAVRGAGMLNDLQMHPH